jgi:hypothetical protein
MRGLFVVAILASGAVIGMHDPSFAACFGSGALQHCYGFDKSGNPYTFQQAGRQEYLNGFDSKTGGAWSMNSTRLGNTTIYHGMSNGNSWNMTDQRFGSTLVTTYKDSNGRSFVQTCTKFGCTTQR